MPSETYCDPKDLAHFPDIGDEAPELWRKFLEQTSIPTLDITGGAPEMHPDFREIVQRARSLGAT